MKTSSLVRRDFLRWMGLAGLGTALPGSVLLPRQARAAAAAPTPLFVAFEAIGAWDITLLCDPRGNNGQSNTPNLGYAPADIKTYGNLQIAPQVAAVADFFSIYYKQALVINGIDTGTIDHGTGMRSSMSGYSATGYPVTAALIGAVLGGNLPAPFMANGGAVDTANLVGMTQLGGGIADALLTPMSGGAIHRPEVWVQVQAAIKARLAREQQAALATQRAQRLKLMQEAMVGADGMTVLSDTIGLIAANVPNANPNYPSLGATDGGTALNIQVGLAGYLHGQTAALQIAAGLFDTHSDNDNGQAGNMTYLFSAIDYLLRAADFLKLSDSLLVYAGSDFSRAPYYNGSSNGKDHWPTTSSLIINPSSSPNTPVNTVIGASDAGLNPVAVDPLTLKPSSSGVNIQPGHVHDALRRYFGIAAAPLAQIYTLHMDNQLPLLG